MEKIDFKTRLKFKRESRYDLIDQTAKKLGKTTGQLLGLTRGISHRDLIKILQSVEALSRDKGLPFEQSWWWHYNEISNSLK